MGSRPASRWPGRPRSARDGRPRRPPRTSPPRAPAAPLHRQRDVLDVEVLVDALAAALAPEARRLDAAERRGGVGDQSLVEADHAGLQLLADAERALEVGCVDVGDEAELGV